MKNTFWYKLIIKYYILIRIKLQIIYYNKLMRSFSDLNQYDFTKNQGDLLYRILIFAKQNVPYYMDIFANNNFKRNSIFETVRLLPLLDKSIIRDQQEKMFPQNFNSARHMNWMNTGGSTGEPLLFPVTNNLEAVHQFALYKLMGLGWDDLIVSIDGSRVNIESRRENIFWTFNDSNIVYGKTHFSVLYMNDNTLPYYLNELMKIKPSAIRGYPSGLMKIAEFMTINKISLDFKLKGIYLTSEYYDQSIVSYLVSSFQCPVFGQYGHAEASIFAFTRSNELTYFCSPLYGFTEILNDEGNHVDIGELGEIVVTGFYNKCMPFIRYRTGDLAIYGGNYNGFVKLDSLQGRTVDFLVNSEGEKVFLIGLIFGGHLKCFENIISWQIEQSIKGLVNIHIQKDRHYSKSDEEEINTLLLSAKIGCAFFYVNDLKLARSGKRKFLIQNIID